MTEYQELLFLFYRKLSIGFSLGWRRPSDSAWRPCDVQINPICSLCCYSEQRWKHAKKTYRQQTISLNWQIYCSWIQCTMFWWHGALFCGFNFDAAGQWGQKGQKQPVKFIPVSLLFSPVPEFPEGFWHLFCVVLFFTAAAFQDPLNGLCRIQGQTSSKSLPQLNYSIPDEQVAWLLFAN